MFQNSEILVGKICLSINKHASDKRPTYYKHFSSTVPCLVLRMMIAYIQKEKSPFPTIWDNYDDGEDEDYDDVKCKLDGYLAHPPSSFETSLTLFSIGQ